ncbi:MAG: SIMPL domain-containing protein [Acidobacteriota bacterium]
MVRSSFFLAALALSAVFASSASAQTIQVSPANKTIAITATDEATEPADVAAVSLGYEVYGPDSASAYAQGGRISQAVLEALHKLGVADKNIESGSQGLERYNDFNNKDTPAERAQKQFVMRQSWTVTVAPAQAAEVIRAAVAAGANQSGSIDWKVADRPELQARAAAAALVKARTIAAQMAAGLHVKLGDLVYASNQAPEVRPAFRALVAGAAKAPAPAPPLLEIRPQTVREEATVYAVFAVE